MKAHALDLSGSVSFREGDHLLDTGLEPRDELKAGNLVLIGMRRARPIPHVANVVEMLVA